MDTERRTPCEHRDTEGRALWEDRVRDWMEASTSQRTPRIASNHQKLGGQHGTEPSSEPPGGTKPLDFRRPGFRTVKEEISVLSHQFEVLCYGSWGKLMQISGQGDMAL